MTKDKKMAIPPLRFPEFRNDEGWFPEKMDYVCKIGNGRDYKHLNTGDIPVYGSGGYMTSVDDYLYDGESVCIGRKGTINKPIFLSGKFWTVDTLFYTHSFYKCLPKFLFLIFQQIDWYRYNEAGGIPSLSKTTIGNIDIYIPRIEKEQQKIADCLGSLDDLINAVTDKIEALKEYKKGLMQQLFPTEGKTTPTLRFPEFQNAGEWKSRTLSDVCKLVRGPFGGALKKEIFVENGYAVYEQSHAIYGDMNIFRYYITEDKFNELIRFAVRPNDIIMSCSGTMGKFSIIPENFTEGVINQALLKLSTKKDNDYRFIKFLLELPNNQKQLLSDAAGGAIKNVASVSLIKEMPLFIPELKEQQIIADSLSSVDKLISAETDKLEQLKAHKKGLMQQLFPSF